MPHLEVEPPLEQKLPDPLPTEVLARCTSLPTKPNLVALTGHRFILRPLDPEVDAEALYAVTNGSPVTLAGNSIGSYDPDALIWRWMFAGPFDTLHAFKSYLHSLANNPTGAAFCIYHAQTGERLGSASYLNNVPSSLKIELGSIWYSPAAQRTGANTEATYLMLRHAFDLGYQRLEWKCNALNERSRHSALRMGFTFEGIQQWHMIVKGRQRDTAWFRILASEWPAVRQHLEQLLTY